MLDVALPIENALPGSVGGTVAVPLSTIREVRHLLECLRTRHSVSYKAVLMENRHRVSCDAMVRELGAILAEVGATQ